MRITTVAMMNTTSSTDSEALENYTYLRCLHLRSVLLLLEITEVCIDANMHEQDNSLLVLGSGLRKMARRHPV